MGSTYSYMMLPSYNFYNNLHDNVQKYNIIFKKLCDFINSDKKLREEKKFAIFNGMELQKQITDNYIIKNTIMQEEKELYNNISNILEHIINTNNNIVDNNDFRLMYYSFQNINKYRNFSNGFDNYINCQEIPKFIKLVCEFNQ
jgi:hypothetical protein